MGYAVPGQGNASALFRDGELGSIYRLRSPGLGEGLSKQLPLPLLHGYLTYGTVGVIDSGGHG